MRHGRLLDGDFDWLGGDGSLLPLDRKGSELEGARLLRDQYEDEACGAFHRARADGKTGRLATPKHHEALRKSEWRQLGGRDVPTQGYRERDGIANVDGRFIHFGGKDEVLG